MLAMILGWLGNLLGGPFATAAVNAYKAKLDAGNSRDRMAADLAARELAVQEVEIQAQNQLRIAELGRWYEPDKLMGYSVAIYFGKLVVWDTMLGFGSTGSLAGWADHTATAITVAYFGKRGIENVARILKR